jgi:hypothetical protein
MRALGVASADGHSLEGEIGIEAKETQWAFAPREPWKAGDYQLVALTILEDMAGKAARLRSISSSRLTGRRSRRA